MKIRNETPADFGEIYTLIKRAFETAEHTDSNEHNLAAALRKSGAFIPELALVAEINGKTAGHIMYSRAEIGGQSVIVLAPLSVAPEFQRRSVGTALVKESLKKAAGLGWQYAFVLGSEKYYPRFGFIPAEKYGAETPAGIPPENFMAIKLRKNAPRLRGRLIYAKEFGI